MISATVDLEDIRSYRAATGSRGIQVGHVWVWSGVGVDKVGHVWVWSGVGVGSCGIQVGQMWVCIDAREN